MENALSNDLIPGNDGIEVNDVIPEEKNEDQDYSDHTYELKDQEEGNQEDAKSTDEFEIEQGNPYMIQIKKLTLELNQLREENTVYQNSIQVYKEMLVERDATIRELNDSRLQNIANLNSEGSTIEGI